MDNGEDNENARIDICNCLCVLLAKSESAKRVAVEENFLKRLIEICGDNLSALHLSEL